MNVKKAEVLIQCHTGAQSESSDPAIQKALQFAFKSEVLKDPLLAQMELDAQAEAAISAMTLPAHLENPFESFELPARKRPGLGRILRQPPVLAVAIAIVVMVGWFVYYSPVHSDDFQGKDDVLQMLDLDKTNEMSRSEFDLGNTETGDMGDLLFSQYGFENYYIPPELAHLKTVGSRVFKQDSFPVVQIGIEKHQSFLFVFRADDFGVKVTPPDRWRIFEDDEWSIGILSHGEVCVVVAFQGKKEDMKRFLATGQ